MRECMLPGSTIQLSATRAGALEASPPVGQ